MINLQYNVYSSHVFFTWMGLEMQFLCIICCIQIAFSFQGNYKKKVQFNSLLPGMKVSANVIQVRMQCYMHLLMF